MFSSVVFILDIIGEEMSDDSNDHALLLAASHNNKVEIWHLGLVNGLFTYQSATIGVMLIEHFEKAVVDIAFSPDSTAVAVASLDGTVCFFTVIYILGVFLVLIFINGLLL